MHLTTVLILLPLFMFLLMVGMRHGTPKLLAMIGAVVEFGISIYVWINFQATGERQFTTAIQWTNGLGMGFNVGIDGISLPLVLLTTTLVPLIILSSNEKSISRPQLFYGLILLMHSALIGVFTSFDALLFYIFW